MSKRKKIALIIYLLSILCSCSSHYLNIKLVKVKAGSEIIGSPDNGTVHSGYFNNDGNKPVQYFEDSQIKATWASDGSGFFLIWENKTEQRSKIIWDEATYQDPDGFTQNIYHSDILIKDRSKSQIPSILPPKEKISDFIMPSRLTYWTDRGWKFGALIGEKLRLNSDTVNFEVILPVEYDSMKTSYSFNFRLLPGPSKAYRDSVNAEKYRSIYEKDKTKNRKTIF